MIRKVIQNTMSIWSLTLSMPGESEDRASEGENYNILHCDVQTIEREKQVPIFTRILQNDKY